MSATPINITITATTEEVNAALQGIETQTTGLTEALQQSGKAGLEAGDEISEGMQKAEYSVLEARHGAMMLTEEFGVRLPRALAGVAAKSEVLGPILETAFKGLAAVAFIEIAKQIAEKLTELYVKTFIFTDAMKAMDEANKKSNDTLSEMSSKLKEAQDGYALIGLSGAALAKAQFEKVTEEVNKNTTALHAAQDQAYAYSHGMIEGTEEQINANQNLINVLNAKIKLGQQDQASRSKEYDIEQAKTAEEAAKKEAAEVQHLQEEFQKWHQDMDGAYTDAQAHTQQLTTELQKLNEEFNFKGNLDAFKESLGGDQEQPKVPASVTNLLEQHKKSITDLKQMQQEIRTTEGFMEQFLDLQTLMTKGWGAFGQQAVHSLESVGIALAEHTALALLLDDKVKLSAAKTAAAQAYKAEAGIPIIGPALGAIAAAAAFTSIMAFEGGGLTPDGPSSGTMALLHPQEMVLPKHLSDGIQRIIENGQSGGGGSSNITVHAMDAGSFKDYLHRNPAALASGVHHASSTGHLNAGKLVRGK